MKRAISIILAAVCMICVCGTVKVKAWAEDTYDSTTYNAKYQVINEEALGYNVIAQAPAGLETELYEGWIINADGDAIISGGEATHVEYLGKDLAAVSYGPRDYAYREEYADTYIVNLKTGKKYKVKTYEKTQRNNRKSSAADATIMVYPYASNGYARVQDGYENDNTSYSGAAAQCYNSYYYFIDKKGKTVIKKQYYQECTDFVKNGDKMVYYTRSACEDLGGLDIHLKMSNKVTMRDETGKSIKTLDVGYKFQKINIVEYNGVKYLAFYAYVSGQIKADLYTLNFKKVDKYELETRLYLTQVPLSSAYLEGVKIKGGEVEKTYKNSFVQITPFTTGATCIDVSGGSYGTSGVGLWTTKKLEKDTNPWSSNYDRYNHDAYNQFFAFVPVEGKEDSYYIVNRKSRLQLVSATDNTGATWIMQGTGKDAKENVFKITENSDGSIYIQDYAGRYLTMCYGSTDAGTALRFVDFADGASKQKFAVPGVGKKNPIPSKGVESGDAVIHADQTLYKYDGKSHFPKIYIMRDGKKLTEGKDYTLTAYREKWTADPIEEMVEVDRYAIYAYEIGENGKRGKYIGTLHVEIEK